MEQKTVNEWTSETKILASERAEQIRTQFEAEVSRLLSSGAVGNDTSRAMLFGVALENIADGFLRGDRKTKAYRTLTRF